jgi:hypothetical protein
MLRRFAMFTPLLALALGCPAGDADTDTDTATAGSTAASSEPTTGEAADLTCDDYCARITTNCAGDFVQYGLDTCKSSCAAFEPGTLDDKMGNTLGCRIYHAGAAKDAPELHCVHAGPGGASVCGDNCEGFCTIAASACPDTFTDDAACMTACAAYDMTEPYDVSDVAGDTFACRLYHLTVATNLPAEHCPHITPTSVPCGG